MADYPIIVGKSLKIKNLCRDIGKFAPSDLSVLIEGDTGTGKELVANAVQSLSHRNTEPYVKVNCGALPENLLESELFGHVKGSFTGAHDNRDGRFILANKGTILLDEISNMSLVGQAKLLRVLQEGEFEPVGSSQTSKCDVRVIATTNIPLKQAILKNKFREDLFYRLSAVMLTLPPLRERRGDIPMLADHFMKPQNRILGKRITGFTQEALKLLDEYDWPGNVRELRNVIEVAVTLEESELITPASISVKPQSRPDEDGPYKLYLSPDGLHSTLLEVEKWAILEALKETSGNRRNTSDLLGINQKNLGYYLKKHNISEQEIEKHLKRQKSAMALPQDIDAVSVSERRRLNRTWMPFKSLVFLSTDSLFNGAYAYILGQNISIRGMMGLMEENFNPGKNNYFANIPQTFPETHHHRSRSSMEVR